MNANKCSVPLFLNNPPPFSLWRGDVIGNFLKRHLIRVCVCVCVCPSARARAALRINTLPPAAFGATAFPTRRSICKIDDRTFFVAAHCARVAYEG